MSQEQVPQITHSELYSAIDKAAVVAQDATKRYKFNGNESRHDEAILSYDALGGDPASTVIERNNDPWFKDKTKINIHVQKPEELGEDPYHRAGTDYNVKINGQIGANTTIQRTNEKGEVVYTHETEDLQLARRIGKVGAQVSVRQNSKRADELEKAA